MVGVVTSAADTLAAVVSCNPATWYGTRAAGISAEYSTYELKALALRFIPAKGSDTSGVLAMGTNWDDGGFDPTSFSALSATEGGVAASPFTMAECRPSLAGLRQPKFNMDMARGDSEPFRFGATTIGAPDGILGYLFVVYNIALFNPSPGSTVIVNTGVQNVSFPAAAEGAPVEVDITGSVPSYLILIKNAVDAGLIGLDAGIRYTLEQTATTSRYLVKKAGSELLHSAALAGVASMQAYLYRRGIPEVGF
jgi:hypothetical protein